jgi:hypothetical protein
MLMTSALFWDITRRRVVIVYRRFGTTYRSHRLGLLTLEVGIDTLSRNFGKKLPHDAGFYLFHFICFAPFIFFTMGDLKLQVTSSSSSPPFSSSSSSFIHLLLVWCFGPFSGRGLSFAVF